jgi:hypothetical protein
MPDSFRLAASSFSLIATGNDYRPRNHALGDDVSVSDSGNIEQSQASQHMRGLAGLAY